MVGRAGKGGLDSGTVVPFFAVDYDGGVVDGVDLDTEEGHGHLEVSVSLGIIELGSDFVGGAYGAGHAYGMSVYSLLELQDG